MTGLHYPDNLYADHEERKARRSQQPTGAYDGRGAGSPPWRPGHGFVDPVTKPAHYQRAGIETIDYIRATLGDGFEAYCIGNVLKYVSRYREKGGIEDLRKAQVYLGWAIEPKPSEGETPTPGIYFDSEATRDAFEQECLEHIRHGFSILDTVERIPKWDVRWGRPPNCDGLSARDVRAPHPMQAEEIRDHDERLSGAEDRL